MILEHVATKRCGHCREVKLLDEFHRNNQTKDGRHGWCRVCLNADMRSRYTRREHRPSLAGRQEKVCGRCRVIKAITEFTCNKNTVDGRHGWCRSCTKEYARSRHVSTREVVPPGMKRCPHCHELKALDDFGVNRVKAGHVRSYCRPCENATNRVRARAYLKTDRGRENSRRQARQGWRNGKNKARQYVGLALHFGDLVRSPCEVCGATTVQAHHEDYSKPLRVRWLCVEHHGAVHRHRKEVVLP